MPAQGVASIDNFPRLDTVSIMRRLLLPLLLLSSACGDSDSKEPESEAPKGLPDALGFEFTRPDVGTPPTTAEVDAFTRKLTGFWKRVGFFQWVLRNSHGVHASTGKRDFMFWWGADVFREGDTVRFYHSDPDGGGHNIMIPTPRVLSSALSGYLLTGDTHMAQVAEQYCKGITATMLGMVHDENDPIDFLMARNIAAFNHTYQTEEGYTKVIDYSGWFTNYSHWNTGRFEYANNPTWGSVWVTNMRSKDDVPHIYLAVPSIIFAAERAESPAVKEACGETLRYLRAFTNDIVEQGYKIRTKDANGVPYVPGESGNAEADSAAGDLASFVRWEKVVPGAECNARRTSALIATGKGLDNDCDTGGVNAYELIATGTHYYNFDIVRFFHLAHLANALVNRDDKAAKKLLEGMAARIDGYLETPDSGLNVPRSQWENDVALLSLRAAAFGLPLTSRESKLIQQKWGQGVDEFLPWEYWDFWKPGIPDGPLPMRPGHTRDDDHWTRIEDMAMVLEYCWSPLRNPASVPFVDCALVADPSRWDDSALDTP